MSFFFSILYFSKTATADLQSFLFKHSSLERAKTHRNFENINENQERQNMSKQINNFEEIYVMSRKKYIDIEKITKRTEGKERMFKKSFYNNKKKIKRVSRSLNANNESDSFINHQNIEDIETQQLSVHIFRYNDAYEASDPFVRLTSSIVKNFDKGKHIQIDAIQSDLPNDILIKILEIKTNEDYNQTTSDLLKQDMDTKYFNDFSDFNIEDGLSQKMTLFNASDPDNFDMNSSIQKANAFLNNYNKQAKKQRIVHDDTYDDSDFTTMSPEYENERRLRAIRIINENSNVKNKEPKNSNEIDIIPDTSQRYLNDTVEYKDPKRNLTNVATQRNITNVNIIKELDENHNEFNNKNIGITVSSNDNFISNISKLYNNTIKNAMNISMNMTVYNKTVESRKNYQKPDSQQILYTKARTTNTNLGFMSISFIHLFYDMLLNEKYKDLYKENETTSNISFIKTQDNIEKDILSENTNFNKDLSEVVSSQKVESNLELDDKVKDNFKSNVRKKYIFTEEIPDYGILYDSHYIIN